MNRKNLVLLLTLLLLAVSTQAVESPNIIFFLADDMGMGDTSAYQDWSGNPDNAQLHTPAMDELARVGIRFTDAHSPSSFCSPSRYALMTGRYCWRTLLKQFVLYGVQCDPLIDRDRLTLPEFLQSAGYQTGMVGKWHLGLSYTSRDDGVAKGWEDADLSKPVADGPMDHGFDFFYGMSRSHPTSGPDGARRNTMDQAIGPGWMRNRTIIGATGQGKELDGTYRLNEIGERLDEEAFNFIKSVVSQAKPFFLYFASPANHAPYTPSKAIGGIKVAGASRNVDGSPGNTRLDFVYQNDVHIARLLAYLKETDDPRRPGKPLIENTLFVFSSDNGAERPVKQYTGPLRSNKGSTYEGGHRVPFIATWPLGGIGDGNPESKGKTCERLLSLTDMYATFAEIVNKPLPPLKGKGRGAEDSVSQLAAMKGLQYRPRIPVFSNDHKEAPAKRGHGLAWVGVRSNCAPVPGKWKLFLDQSFVYEQKLNPMELYNLETDQQETTNLLSPEHEAVLNFLKEQARLAGGDDGSTRQLQE